MIESIKVDFSIVWQREGKTNENTNNLRTMASVEKTFNLNNNSMSIKCLAEMIWPTLVKREYILVALLKMNFATISSQGPLIFQKGYF